MQNQPIEHRYGINDLIRVMQRLRDPESGCPWDLQQDFSSIVPHTLEECYELADAIERSDLPHVAEELGDVLFQVIFYSQLGSEQAAFSFEDVAHGVTEKLLRRHPHVFAGGEIEGVVDGEASIADIKANWEQTKAQERADKQQHGLLADVPLSLPALSRAQKIQKRAARVGFDWDSLDDVLACLESEVKELREAIANESSAAIQAELGDVMFSAVNVARHLGCDAEQTLRAATHRFESRFQHMETAATNDGKQLADESSEQLERRWQAAKQASSAL
jgi:ATP diphosphatase